MEKLIGHQLQQSEKVDELIKGLVSEVIERGKEILGPKDPQESYLANNKEIVDSVGVNRGRPLYFPYVGTGIGRGPYVELEDGSIKLDLINGIGIHVLGHSHPEVTAAALKAALSDVIIQGNLQPNIEYAKMDQKLVDLASKSSRLKHAWLTTSGSMANENALKSCRQKKSPARKVIAMEAAFAGRTTMMAEITDNPSFKVGLPEYNEILRVPFYDKNNPKSIEDSLNIFKGHLEKNKGDICAFMFEPMQGEGGYNVAPREFFLPMLELCKQEDIPVWLDEVQTFCRTGQFFAFETLGIGEYVDVCTIAKTAQVGATFYTQELNPQPGLISGTFAGSSVALSAGLKILDILESQGYMGQDGKVSQIHKKFVGMLNRLNESTCKGQLTDAGGLGLMVAVTPLDGSKEKMLKLLNILYKNGLMSFGCGKGPFRLRFLLPAVLTEKDVEVAAQIIEKSIQEMN